MRHDITVKKGQYLCIKLPKHEYDVFNGNDPQTINVTMAGKNNVFDDDYVFTSGYNITIGPEGDFMVDLPASLTETFTKKNIMYDIVIYDGLGYVQYVYYGVIKTLEF